MHGRRQETNAIECTTNCRIRRGHSGDCRRSLSMDSIMLTALDTERLWLWPFFWTIWIGMFSLLCTELGHGAYDDLLTSHSMFLAFFKFGASGGSLEVKTTYDGLVAVQMANIPSQVNSRAPNNVPPSDSDILKRETSQSVEAARFSFHYFAQHCIILSLVNKACHILRTSPYGYLPRVCPCQSTENLPKGREAVRLYHVGSLLRQERLVLCSRTRILWILCYDLCLLIFPVLSKSCFF